jgi:ferredoxin, 2Fe-2S
MPTILYIEHTGRPHSVDVPAGQTIMEGATSHAIPGIDAECGGMCTCATCHVYIEDRASILPDMTGIEEDMLEFVEERRATSRLSCRLVVDDRFDGMVVEIPAEQS